jgi:hypothetical protein
MLVRGLAGLWRLKTIRQPYITKLLLSNLAERNDVLLRRKRLCDIEDGHVDGKAE